MRTTTESRQQVFASVIALRTTEDAIESARSALEGVPWVGYASRHLEVLTLELQDVRTQLERALGADAPTP